MQIDISGIWRVLRMPVLFFGFIFLWGWGFDLLDGFIFSVIVLMSPIMILAMVFFAVSEELDLSRLKDRVSQMEEFDS